MPLPNTNYSDDNFKNIPLGIVNIVYFPATDYIFLSVKTRIYVVLGVILLILILFVGNVLDNIHKEGHRIHLTRSR